MTGPFFWKCVLTAAIGLYFGLGIVITIGGWFDVWKMLRRLSAGERASKNG
ncbi:MAG: hypothetical protein ACPMAQ_00640 [Phycisphaerae bacterium]